MIFKCIWEKNDKDIVEISLKNILLQYLKFNIKQEDICTIWSRYRYTDICTCDI